MGHLGALLGWYQKLVLGILQVQCKGVISGVPDVKS